MTFYHPFFLTFLTSTLLCAAMIFYGVKDIPNERSSHTIPTPRSGGVGITGATFLAILLTPDWLLCQMLLPAGAISLVGFLDDRFSLSPFVRLFSQFFLSVVFVFLFKEQDLPLLFLILAAFWFTGYTNAFNFMDGLNGLAGGTALITLLTLSFLGFSYSSPLLFNGGLILSAATLGFLLFNFPKGRLFLGDGGSYFLGFSMMSLLFVGCSLKEIPFWSFPLLTFFFVFETIFTVIRRLLKKRNIFSAHRDHLYQLLHRAGWSHTKVSLLYWVFSLIQGSMALSLPHITPLHQGILLLPLLIAGSLYARWVLRYATQKGVDI